MALEIRELFKVDTIDKLLSALNDRFRAWNEQARNIVTNPAQKDTPLDVGGNPVVNLADPRDAMDAVNLRTLRLHTGRRQVTSTAEAAAVVPVNPDTAVTVDNVAVPGASQTTSDEKGDSLSFHMFAAKGQ